MKTQEVTIRVFPETASALITALKGATKADQARLNFLMQIWAASMTETQSLDELMDSASDIAEANGFTIETLNSILNEK
jgi:hypothetical protein